MDVVPDCPTCGGNSAVTATTTGDTVTYRCAATYAHDDHQPRFWTVARDQPRAPRAASTRTTTPRSTTPRTPRATTPRAARAAAAPTTTAAELTEPLLGVLQTLPHVWIEHGVVEYALRTLRPELFGRHVADAGHVLLRDGAGSGTTASGLRFATALFKLEREGAVTHFNAPPTGGAWTQDRLVGWWAIRPKPPRTDLLSWETFAVDTLGREDGDWTDEDRAEVARLAGRR